MTPPAGDSAPGPEGLRLSACSRELRRDLGATAWAALEAILLSATPLPDSLAAITSARRLAEDLSVSKDTAARALRRLISYGLLVRRPGGHSASGQFAPGGYEIRLDRITGVELEAGASPAPVEPHTPRRPIPCVRQPALFDLEETMP